MIVATPRWLEQAASVRVGLHFFRCGFHFKLRRGMRWRHFVVKANRSAAFGEQRKRRMLWIGTWTSEKGVKGQLNGFRFVVACDRLPSSPRDSIRVPFFPQSRSRERERDR